MLKPKATKGRHAFSGFDVMILKDSMMNFFFILKTTLGKCLGGPLG